MAVDSDIAGFGLAPRQGGALDWMELEGRPVVLPMLGRETGLNSAAEADVFGRILRGSFTLLPFCELEQKWPGTRWVRRGHVIEAARGSERAGAFAADEEVLQVALEQSLNHTLALTLALTLTLTSCCRWRSNTTSTTEPKP